jgi:RNA polymerase-binding transcription factor DksA
MALAKKKPARKTSGSRSSARSSASSSKKRTSKRVSKKAGGRKKSAKKTTKRATTKKKPAKKKAAARKKVKKTPAKKTPGPRKKVAKKAATKAGAPASRPEAETPDKKSGRKGITIVKPKPARRHSTTPSKVTIPTFGSGILSPGAPKRKPLIPSGPSASSAPGEEGGENQRLKKSPFKKRELMKFREVLLRKRAELIGDVSTMENEALRSESGSTSHLPQHMAEQGSDTYDQAISLDLAAADRQLIREIDAALRRISDGVYGICELTGRPIRPDRLEELPWARYSIDAAREIERRST